MKKAIHVSKERIKANRKAGNNFPFIRVIAASGRDGFGHKAYWNGPTLLRNFANLPDGEQHVHVETDALVLLTNEISGEEQVFE